MNDSTKLKILSNHTKPEVDKTIQTSNPFKEEKTKQKIKVQKVKPEISAKNISVTSTSSRLHKICKYPFTMFAWSNKNNKPKQTEVYDSVAEGLKKLYKNNLYPLEDAYKYHDFQSPALHDPDFDAKPMVLLIGQYSTGKTTFIKYLLESEFPGIRIGPEPTTDRFIAVMHGKSEGVIPGNALVVDPNKQFRPLSKFGNTFLNRLQCSTLNNKVSLYSIIHNYIIY